MRQREVFVFKATAIDRRAARAVTRRDVSTLEHARHSQPVLRRRLVRPGLPHDDMGDDRLVEDGAGRAWIMNRGMVRWIGDIAEM